MLKQVDEPSPLLGGSGSDSKSSGSSNPDIFNEHI